MATKTKLGKNQPASGLFENQKFYSVKQAAANLNVSEDTVRSWIYRGQLTALRIGPPQLRGKIALRGSDLAAMITVAYEQEC